MKIKQKLSLIKYIIDHLIQLYNYPYIKKQFKGYGRYVQVASPNNLSPSNIILEDNTRIQSNVYFISYAGILKVKKYSAISSGVTIIPGSHIPTVGIPQFLSFTHINDEKGLITINEDAWIGAGAFLMSHADVGRGAIVGAGSIVTKTIPPYAVVAGIPSKIIAVRFSIEQIIEHEKILYPKEERYTKKYLTELFEKYYTGKKVIGTSYISESDKTLLERFKEKYNIKDYNHEL